MRMTSMNACEIPEQIQWHEGLLLAPQHFQQSSLRFESLLAYATSTIAPYCWGVHHFRIDPTALVAGTVRILELEAVMPDCLVVSHNHQSDQPLELDLTSHTDQIRAAPVA